MENFPKICTCCKKSYSEREWNRLPAARGGLRMDIGDGTALELRNCACTGTMAIEIQTAREPAQASA